ncbi:MAG: hypothetical protein EA422_13655 [Gemmatimonadales bacterium]|nr:MAG: hypothetical protein EA422_13655 [Gemmatimonadales bacterium]
MSEKPPFDWTELQKRWQSEEVPPEVESGARRRMERDRRRLVGELVLTGIVVPGVGAWSVGVLTTDPEPATIVAMLVFWTFAGILIGAGILNQRGMWAPAEESTRSYLRLSLERARRKAELSRFGLWLMAFWFVMAGGLLIWSAVEAIQSDQALLPVLLRGALILGLTFGVLGVFTERSRRRARETAAELEATLHALDEEGADGGSWDGRVSQGTPP